MQIPQKMIFETSYCGSRRLVFLKEKGGFLLAASCDGHISCQEEHVDDSWR